MPHLLPTICSRNRQVERQDRFRRRVVPRHDPLPPPNICNHRVTLFGGRCPVCYRQSIRNYGRTLVLPRVNPPRGLPVFRPPPAPTFPIRPHIRRPPPAPMFPIRRPPPGPRLPHPYQPRPVQSPPVVISSNYLKRYGLVLPGRTVIAPNISDMCPICQDDYTKDPHCQITPCSHCFHAWCFAKWFTRNKSCPLCRKTFC